MANLLEELIAQRAALDIQISQARASERLVGIRRVQALMKEFGLTASDVSGTPPSKPNARSSVPAKLRDPETGSTWSGRGLKPKWLSARTAAGKKLEDFAV